MIPLEPKPPDPSILASFSLSWNLSCSCSPQYCQKLTDFTFQLRALYLPWLTDLAIQGVAVMQFLSFGVFSLSFGSHS